MLVDKDTETTIKAIGLKNALEYNGRARTDAVIAKIMACRVDLRRDLKNLIPEIKEIVQKINVLSLSDQKALLEQIGGAKVKQEGRTDRSYAHLPPLEYAEVGNVVTRFPPEPNGYPHIGHAKAAIIDEEYARMYNGKLILRFDDTNPLNEKLEYYDAINEGLEWLGIKPDTVKNTSDDIQLLHDYGKKLILNDSAYVCTCKPETIHTLRAKGISCECRKDPNISLDRSKKMFSNSFAQNEAIIRFKGNMSSQNTALRDPTLFRIIEGDHPKLHKQIRVWPTYDFAAPIEDSLDGITHALRTKEYELRNALYFAILDRLNLRKPFLTEFSRLEFDGIPISKRKIKQLIENGIVKSWDDPRLPTLMAMKRRGFLPEAIRKFVLSLGMTLAETKPPIKTLESLNRKIIDPQCRRLFFVKDPVELQVLGAVSKEVVLRNHPNNIDLYVRKVQVSNSFYISREDALEFFNTGTEFRLIELFNVKIVEIKSDSQNQVFVAIQTGDEMKQSTPKIQWVAKEDAYPYKIIIARELYRGEEYNKDSLEIVDGVAESFVSSLNRGTMIQFVRFGFCRIDSNEVAILTHR